MEVSGFILREEGDFYYLDLRPSEAEAELRSRASLAAGGSFTDSPGSSSCLQSRRPRPQSRKS